MGILTWLLLGLAAGWIASLIMGTNSRQGMMMDIILGVIGAFVGGFLMNLFGQTGVNGFNVYSVVVATLGAIALIYMGRVLRTTT